MKRIIKNKPPEEWEKFIKKNPGVQYSELDRIKHGKEVRQILHSSLIEEQSGLCCYCSRVIDDGSSHNEHLKSRTDYPKESMRYQNIVASCNSLTTCGKYKDKKSITVNYVSPLEEDCESNFSWDSSGNIFGENERAQKTIELLNLNESNLKSSRFAVIKYCTETAKSLYESGDDGKEYIRQEFIESQNGEARFPDMIKWLYDKGYFDSDGI